MSKSKWPTVKKMLGQLTNWIADGEQIKDICNQKNHMLPISESTFYDYISKHSEFSEAIKKGRERAKDTVEATLRSKLVPQERTEVIVEEWEDAEGNRKTHTKKRKYIVEPDTTVLIFMAKNLLPDIYYDRKGSPADEKLLAEKLKSEIERNKSQTKLQDTIKTRPIIITDMNRDDDEDVDTND
ncbi:hypothetical protein F5ESL0236_08015 [Lactobacillus sp. ESL0236]|nr:hypothetical protein F5ESL0237_08090 [Lactobacillus sp. ESL0237]RMC42569.1 hypothetical protein F5ESL0234_07735 [Lactobacillus sp. ESL0234]RMC43283.1 hypothetical protein F5ESL0236_08015 [Lactobacillus sp. ESL0236]